MNYKKGFVRFVFLIVGLLILGLGIALTLEAKDLGTSAIDALQYGLSEKFGRSVGFWVFVVGVVLVMSTALLELKLPKFQAAIPVFILGQAVDMWITLFTPFEPATLLIEILFLLAGTLVIALGAAVYLTPNLVATPLDLFTIALGTKINRSFGFAKTIVEISALLLALLVGGPIWFGTIVITVTVGPCIQYFLKPVGRLQKRLFSRIEEPA